MDKTPERSLSAKELTAAIEEATDATVQHEQNNDAKLESDRGSHKVDMSPSTEVARGLGRAGMIASDDEVKRLVALENGYANADNLTAGENVVGGESELEVKERLETDLETAKIQSGVDLAPEQMWMHEISKRNNKKIAESVQQAVGQITAKPDFNPNMLEKLRFQMMLGAMQSDEGYKFGERN